jgi:hypothetical protein
VLLGVVGCKVSKKTEKLIKSRKLKKPNREKKPIRILKKPTGSVRFGFSFIGLKLKKPNRIQTKKN